MISIVCGTNRNDAVSRKLSDLYHDMISSRGEECQVLDLSELPDDFAFSALYDQSGTNANFNVFRDKMLHSTKFVFVVPEYNGSFPGVLKTFIDGLQFPDTFMGKKCAVVGLSSGTQGGGLAVSHLTDIFNYCGMHVLAQKPRLAQIEVNMDLQTGEITNPLYMELIEEQVDKFMEF